MIHRRCGCREDGRQLGINCSQLASDPKHGSWTYEFRAKGGKYRKGGFRTKDEARREATKVRASLDAGTYVEPSKKTLAQYAPEALQRRQVTGSGLKPTTFATYERYVRQDIIPSQLGRMLLTEIRRSHVNQWVADLSKTRGATTVRRALATLQMILSMAVRDEIIPASPAAKVDKPAVATQDQPVKVWDLPDIGRFLDRAQIHRLGALFELVIHTGLRRGEITGLHWADVDLLKRQIVVRHNRVSVDGRVQETTTKSRSGARTVPLSDAAVAALLGWQLHQAGEREAAQEAWETAGHVFTMEDGRALDPAYVTRLFNKLSTDLHELTFHGLRHCAISLWIAGGADLSTVSKLAGHSSVAITADVYAHMVAAVGQRAVDGGAALIARTTPAQSGLDA